MVTPLYLASLFIDKRNFLAKPIFRKPFREVTFLSKTHMITVSNMVSFVMFVGMGLLTIFLSLSGKLAMNRSEESVTQAIQNVAVSVTTFVQKIPGLDIIFSLVAFWLLYKLIKYISREK
jgi:hypothetical protein